MESNQAYSGVDNLEIMQEAANYNRYLLDLVHRHAPQRARTLDFGAGNGQFAGPVAALGYAVTALEPDRGLRELLARKGLRTVAGCEELQDESLDYVYTLNVLEHINDDVGALRQVRAKLVTGGRLLAYVPAFPVLYTSMDHKVGHVRRYTRKTLSAALTAAGFRVERAAYVDCLGFFATLVFKAVGNQDGSVNRSALKLYDRAVFPLSRALDSVTQRWFGKNLLVLARK
ncbi:MAG TPA: class I SAM-dependent methyltransferase [Steroidobacteraceae bacterium]|jgi:SAM-dependent methyltransferase